MPPPTKPSDNIVARMLEAHLFGMGMTEAQIRTQGELWYQKMAEKVLACMLDDAACADGAVLAWRNSTGVMGFESAGVLDSVAVERAVTKDPTGFVSPATTTITYDSGARTITITQVGGVVQMMVNGVVWTKPSPWVSSGHAAVNGRYYLTMSTITGSAVLVWSPSSWTFDEFQIAYVNYNDPAGVSFAQRECHGCSLPWPAHEVMHRQIGTFKSTGGLLTAGTFNVQPAVPVDADNTPGVDACTIHDEDLVSILSAWIQGTYTTVKFTGVGLAAFDVASAYIHRRPAGTYIHYNPWSGVAFSEVEGATNKYYNVYAIMFPASADAESQKHRVWWLQPQYEYNSANAAAAEDFRSLNLGDLTTLASEFVATVRVTFYAAAAYGTHGKVRIHAVSYLVGSKASQALVASSIPSHSVLPDRSLASAHPATAIDYDNATSGLTATVVQSAIDELTGRTEPWLIQLTDSHQVDGASPGPLAQAQFYLDPTEHPAGAQFTLRAVLSATGPTAVVTMTVQLYNVTDGEAVGDSLLTCTNTATPTKFDSSAMVPDVNAGDLKTTAKVYEVRVELTAGADANDIGLVGGVSLVRTV